MDIKATLSRLQEEDGRLFLWARTEMRSAMLRVFGAVHGIENWSSHEDLALDRMEQHLIHVFDRAGKVAATEAPAPQVADPTVADFLRATTGAVTVSMPTMPRPNLNPSPSPSVSLNPERDGPNYEAGSDTRNASEQGISAVASSLG